MSSFGLNLLFRPLDLYEWLTVMTGGFPEPYTLEREYSNILNIIKVILRLFWTTNLYLDLY